MDEKALLMLKELRELQKAEDAEAKKALTIENIIAGTYEPKK